MSWALSTLILLTILVALPMFAFALYRFWQFAVLVLFSCTVYLCYGFHEIMLRYYP